MNEIVTSDLSKFGYREKDIAADLLKAHGTSKDITKLLGDNVNVFMNMYSGYVFLSDEDYNTAMLNDNGELEDFLNCPECGEEGLLSELTGEEWGSDCCRECFEHLMGE